MKLLYDTNVILDALTERDYNYRPSQQLVRYSAVGLIKGYITSKQITDIYYCLRKHYKTEVERRDAIKIIMKSFAVLPTTKGDINYCLNSKIADFEDALLDEICSVYCINNLVTNNTKDFKNAKSTVFSPDDIIKLFKTDNNNII